MRRRSGDAYQLQRHAVTTIAIQPDSRAVTEKSKRQRTSEWKDCVATIMSFNRISYLESWEHTPDAFRRQSQSHSSQPPPPLERDNDDDVESDEDAYQDLPDASTSSSFPSTLSYQPCTHRLSFNPVAGPGWNESTVEDRSFARDYRPDIFEDGQRELTLEGPELPLPKTRGAFEVEHRERISMSALYI